MIVIPAIDLKDGKCVRLLQGRQEEVTVYSENPAEVARQWVELGARLLHVVDLDGAFTGEQKNFETIKEIRKSVHVPIELGGGIRDIERIRLIDSIGIDRIIIGTSAAGDPDMVSTVCKEFPGKILAGIDARDGKVAIRGWVEVTEINALDFARKMESAGVTGIIYTDISRDGMLTGPNVEAMAKMVKTVRIPVIASGGVSTIDDISALMQIGDLWGVITGKAIYSGALKLEDAINLVNSER